jgi:hypothetical protein
MYGRGQRLNLGDRMRPSEETKTDAVNQLKDLPSPASNILPHHASPRLATEAASDHAHAGAPRPKGQWTPKMVNGRLKRGGAN